MPEATVDQVFPDVCRQSFPFNIAFEPQTKVLQKLLAQVRCHFGGIAYLRAVPQLALQKASVLATVRP